MPLSVGQRRQLLSDISLVWSQDNCKEKEGRRQLNLVSLFPASWKLSPLLWQAFETQRNR